MSDHTLLKLLADVAGLKYEVSHNPVTKEPDVVYLMEAGFEWDTWNPLEDANQMELVKAGLRRDGHEYVIMTVNLLNHFIVEIVSKDKRVTARHESEAMALAKAIEKMMKGTS